MIKRVFLSALLLSIAVLSSYADEEKKISLNSNDHRSETIELAYCNIFVSLKDADNDDGAILSVGLENTHESNTLLVFDRAYDEKTLKKLTPSLTYDKVFGGSKGKRSIDFCPEVKYTTQVRSSEKMQLISIPATESAPIECKLPIYIAKNKNKNGSKMLLLAKDVINLEIQVELKPDKDYVSLYGEYESLVRKLDSEYFCSNRNHRGESIKTLTRKYEERISDIKKKIQKTVESRGFQPSDRRYNKFMDISAKLDSISLDSKKVTSCPKDRKSSNSSNARQCNYCSLSYDAIYSRLENYYIDIYNGKRTKSQVMSDVDTLHTCAMKHKHSGSSSVKSRISTYYNKIKSLKR